MGAAREQCWLPGNFGQDTEKLEAKGGGGGGEMCHRDSFASLLSYPTR